MFERNIGGRVTLTKPCSMCTFSFSFFIVFLCEATYCKTEERGASVTANDRTIDISVPNTYIAIPEHKSSVLLNSLLGRPHIKTWAK